MDDTLINIIFSLIALFIPLLCLAGFGFWLWMLIDCIQRKLSDNDKTLWILILLFGNLIGAIIYFFMVKQKK